MKIGILADIHGDVENLQRAIEALTRRQVDQFVVLGDLIYDTRNADETVDLLNQCAAIGVWGNHELGLCVEPDDQIREMYSPQALEFFATLKPRLELGDLLFSHTLPDQDPADPLAYYAGPRPQEEGALKPSFAQFPHRVMMIGHFHQWFAATPASELLLDERQPMRLDSGSRYLFVIHAVMCRWTAIFDTERNTLAPIRL